MSSPNMVVLEGFLTRAEVKFTPQGNAVLNGTIAVSNGQGNGSSYVDFELWNPEETFGEQLENGAGGDDALRIGIRGRIRQDTWETDGQKRSKLKVVAQAVFVPHYSERQEDDQSNNRSQGQSQSHGGSGGGGGGGSGRGSSNRSNSSGGGAGRSNSGGGGGGGRTKAKAKATASADSNDQSNDVPF